ncbi:hypothetical protein ACFSSC_05290 [Corynebacterium mendelii]|uniref:Uncharacterized protein n=1 Tax=Corynebacterium mendelii TaxID=2765362 RepID=A0A939E0F0_9CORY|nr:hypothetical protein [Corynebacterium mendelii]MBN9643187.1 hypothetical protein [Corynebacterium mendelii]
MLGLVFSPDTIAGVYVRGLTAGHVTDSSPRNNLAAESGRNERPEPSDVGYPGEVAGGNHNSSDGATGDGAYREATGQPEADGDNPVPGIPFDPSGKQQADSAEEGAIPAPPLGDEQLRISSESLFGESDAADAAAVPGIHTPPTVGDRTDTRKQCPVDGSGSGQPDVFYFGSFDAATGDGYLPPDVRDTGTSGDGDTAAMWGAAGMALAMSAMWGATVVSRKRRGARTTEGPAAASDGLPPQASVLPVNGVVGRLVSYLRKDEQLKREAERMYNEIMEERVAAWDSNPAHIAVDKGLDDIDDKDIDDGFDDDFEIIHLTGHTPCEMRDTTTDTVSYDTGDTYPAGGHPSRGARGLLSRLIGGRTDDDPVERYRREHGPGGSRL